MHLTCAVSHNQVLEIFPPLADHYCRRRIYLIDEVSDTILAAIVIIEKRRMSEAKIPRLSQLISFFLFQSFCYFPDERWTQVPAFVNVFFFFFTKEIQFIKRNLQRRILSLLLLSIQTNQGLKISWFFFECMKRRRRGRKREGDGEGERQEEKGGGGGGEGGGGGPVSSSRPATEQ